MIFLVWTSKRNVGGGLPDAPKGICTSMGQIPYPMWHSSENPPMKGEFSVGASRTPPPTVLPQPPIYKKLKNKRKTIASKCVILIQSITM